VGGRTSTGGKSRTKSEEFASKGFYEGGLSYHFNRHGKEFDAEDEARYLTLAKKFRNKKAGKEIEEINDVARNRILRYEKSTNTFLSYRKDGTIITFFKPTPKKYWEAERKKRDEKDNRK
jgi:pyocin large subunit-like protein